MGVPGVDLAAGHLGPSVEGLGQRRRVVDCRQGVGDGTSVLPVQGSHRGLHSDNPNLRLGRSLVQFLVETQTLSPTVKSTGRRCLLACTR